MEAGKECVSPVRPQAPSPESPTGDVANAQPTRDCRLAIRGEDEVLRSQEATVANIKASATRSERQLSAFIEFVKRFHEGEAWNAGDVPGYPYSLADILLEALRVLRSIRAWPTNRIGLSSEAACNKFLSSISQVEATINSFVEVKGRLEAETRPIFLLQFIFKAKINDEEIVNLSNYAVNLHDNIDQLKSDSSDIAFFRNFDQSSVEELAILSHVLKNIRDAEGEAQGKLAEVVGAHDRVAVLEGDLRKRSEDFHANSTELVAKITEIRDESTGYLNSISETVAQVAGQASSAGASADKISELLEESSSDRSALAGFVGEVDSARAGLQDLHDKSAAELEKQKQYVVQVEALIERAKSMVSAATVAGLAQAFSDERRTLDSSMKWAMGWFIAGIVSIFFVTLLLAAYVFEIPFSIGDIPLSGAGRTPELGDEITIAGVLSRAIILLAPFWLTLFSARRYRNLFDLRQQYSHKYNMAFSVDGFKQQAPKYEEEIAALVFHVLAESPVTNSKKSGKSMDESPLMSLQELVRLPADRFDAVLGALKGSRET